MTEIMSHLVVIKMKHLSTIILLFINVLVFSQTNENPLYMPLEYQHAYEKGTRSYSGAPGENYWQNRASYDIEATINPVEKTLMGEASINYINNSPDTLYFVVIRLHQDMYKKGAARDRELHVDDVTSGVDIQQVKLNNEIMDLNNRSKAGRLGTNLYIRINQGLAPQASIDLKIDWSFEIPDKTLIRMGALSASTMFIAYWYPQISIYDDIDGWDRFNYGSRQEFYQQDADFEVSLTLPASYAVWATGELKNGKKMYTAEVVNRLEEVMKTDSVIRIFDTPADGLKKQNGEVTWKFEASNVPDFAFALSNENVWDAGSVLVDSASERRVSVHSVYNPEAASTFSLVTYYQQLSMQFFNYKIPGIEYPYPHFTTFLGLKGGGMEFPMMANNGEYTQGDSLANATRTIEVTAHELAHTYFPFLVGVNERKNTWMEEGWATLLGEIATGFIQNEIGIPEQYSMEQQYVSRFAGTEGSIMSVPPMVPSILVREASSHFHVSYFKAYFAYIALNNVLGDSLFLDCLQQYIHQWKGKNPTPYDFFYSFNTTSGRNLNWFWKSWFFEFGFPDLSVTEPVENKITVWNKGGLPISFEIRLKYIDGTQEFIPVSINAWENNMEQFNTDIPSGKEVESVLILPGSVPDVNSVNNMWPAQ
ncbi:MAG: M1 family metallopeptidase [Bacteroidota bacterium]